MSNLKINVSQLCNDCTGCGVCATICTKAITMTINKNGFYEPVIDNEKCTLCGVCTRVCYKNIEQGSNNKIEDSERYLAYSKNDEVRLRASSGGVGEELYKYFIENGYKIVGVTYNVNKEIAEHIIIDKVSDIHKIIGSKYIPSNTIDAFSKLDRK